MIRTLPYGRLPTSAQFESLWYEQMTLRGIPTLHFEQDQFLGTCDLSRRETYEQLSMRHEMSMNEDIDSLEWCESVLQRLDIFWL
jgi:hypothetical protein